METPLDAYRHRGARALVILHERHMRRLLSAWGAADAAKVALPVTSHDAYGSRRALLRHVLVRWRTPLADVPEERFEDRTYPIWGVGYTVDAMLEHAVMHPIRHAFQLEELLADQRA